MDVTVIIPLYNKETTVERCIQSVLGQTQVPSHVIVVDDASSDASPCIVERMRAGDERLQLVRASKNMGPGAARNLGVRMSGSEWVAFIDADDVWSPTFLEQVCTSIILAGADFGSSGRYLLHVRRPGQTATTSRVVLTGSACRALEDMTRWFWRVSLRFHPVHASSAVIRRSLFLTAGGFAEHMRRFEDLQFWARLWLEGRFAFVNEPLSTYQKSWEGLSGGPQRYREISQYAWALTQVLVSAWRRGKPGSGWLLLYLLRFVVLSHLSWLRSILWPRRTR